ncbi:YjcZ family sporulation protein [Sporosarcina sp. A2]
MFGNQCYGEPRYEGACDRGCNQGGGSTFVLLVVLFILLIIVGSAFC